MLSEALRTDIYPIEVRLRDMVALREIPCADELLQGY